MSSDAKPQKEKILNPATGRYVNADGAVGRKLAKSVPKQRVSQRRTTELPSHPIKKYQVYNFGSELTKAGALRNINVSHSLIEVTDSEDVKWIFEWGELKYRSDEDEAIVKPSQTGSKVPTFTYHLGGRQSWIGVKGQSGSMIASHQITIKQLGLFGMWWQNEYGKGRSYPNNCRGWVHLVIAYLGRNPYHDATCASVQKNQMIDHREAMSQYRQSL